MPIIKYRISLENELLRLRQDIFGIAASALTFFMVGRLSLSLVFQPANIATIWPLSGFFLSAVLLTEKMAAYLDRNAVSA